MNLEEDAGHNVRAYPPDKTKKSVSIPGTPGGGQIDNLVGELTRYGGSVTSGPNRFGATFSIDLDIRDPAEVIRRGGDVFDKAARSAGLPDSTIIRAEALTWGHLRCRHASAFRGRSPNSLPGRCGRSRG